MEAGEVVSGGGDGCSIGALAKGLVEHLRFGPRMSQHVIF